ncbi:hypothetical protein DSO57_1036822 [Entomophthora muscae]|uniref:Uncharacterized protein n=1 Tax=Entomophthora muscae TaxID=34485 RepID=A0ACC2U905_9FUNG|nr:hypothetical protein DSO57_1036822 [Entomophthora muscae]
MGERAWWWPKLVRPTSIHAINLSRLPSSSGNAPTKFSLQYYQYPQLTYYNPEAKPKVTRVMLLLLLLLLSRGSSADSLRPEIDFAKLGHFGVGGDFDGLSILPTDFPPSTFDPNTIDRVKILAHYNNTVIRLGTLNQGGSIKASCPLRVGSQNFLYVGGEFSMIDEKPVANVAWMDLTAKKWVSLESGVDGPVYSLACDKELGMVYVGGKFSASSGPEPYPRSQLSPESSGVRAWNHEQAKWQELRFSGVNGPVYSITLRKPGGNVILGGQFNATTDTLEASNPLVNLVDLQPSDIKVHRYETEASENFARSIICGSDSLWNLAISDTGLDEFEILGLDDKPLSLSRVVDNFATPCKPCNLLNVTASQEFLFNPQEVKGLDKLRLKFSSWYGSSVSLKKLELFSQNSVLNGLPQRKDLCEESQHLTSGPKIPSGWLSSKPGSEGSFKIPQSSGPVVFEPAVAKSGIYNINLYLPCPQKDCPGSRQLKISLNNSYDSDAELVSVKSFQNTYSKSLQSIYRGFIAAKKDLGKDDKPLVISIELVPGSKSHELGGLIVEKVATETELQGVFEFRPQAAEPKDASSYSPVEVKRTKNPFQVRVVAATDKELAVGGTLEGKPMAQLWTEHGSLDLIPDGSSFGNVSGLAFVEDKLVIGGQYKFFGPKKQFSYENLAQVDLLTRTWERIYENLTTVSFSGLYNTGTSFHLAGLFDALGTSPVPARMSYLEYSPKDGVASPAFISGNITAISSIPEEDAWLFFSGPINGGESFRSTNVGYFSSKNALIPFPAIIPSNATDFLQGARVNTGLFSPKGITAQQPNSNQTSSMVLGGLFQVGDFSGVAIYRNETWSGLGQPINGEVLTLHCADSDMFIGGEFDGPLDSHSLVKWSFTQESFEKIPVSLSGKPRCSPSNV